MSRIGFRAAGLYALAALLCVTCAGSAIGRARADAQASVRIADVPPGHWSRAAVQETVGRGILTAPGGRFDGSKLVTRAQLTLALAALAKSLARGDWSGATASPVSKAVAAQLTTAPSGGDSSVTRYELAGLLDKVARDVGRNLPAAPAKPYTASTALPAASVPPASKSSPAYGAAQYLARHRMAWGNAVTLKPDATPVTAKQATDAISQMIAGLLMQRVDEPQLRDDAPAGQRPKSGH